MSYHRKREEKTAWSILERVKDHSKLVPGNAYHLRKVLKRDGNTIIDEVHDIVFEKLEDGFLIEQETGNKFSASEFEIFVRK